ncbi:MAG TPA: anti-sigma factor, partial [Candidatus Limnocylindrales bacterium]|nr:anti-sigma factor [Candidatus Limnocylindrales bacterium]
MAMDHAEAHERIADLALDREALSRLASDDPAGWSPRDGAFLQHVRGCSTCRADLVAVRGIDRVLREALGELRDAAAVQPINPPESLRDAVLEATRREPRGAPIRPLPSVAPRDATASVTGRWRIRLPRLTSGQWAAGLAAVLAIAILGGVAGRALAPGGTSQEASIAAAVATLDRVLAAPDHRLVALTTPAGTASGSVAWSSGDFVVLTSALPAAPAGRVYRCWLQWAGQWAAVGSMDFAGSTAYWSGPTGT